MTLTFAELSEANRARADRWHEGSEPWTCSDWSNAMCGEAGEAANVIKKIRRHETGIGSLYNTPELDELRQALADEIADVVLYADLLAGHFDIDVGAAIAAKFNQVSDRQGFPERVTA